MAKLKVFRTPIGFHDAYVAAPSQKAALAVWGADADLFARGAAERVEDPKLTEAPLASPGKVIRVRRGSNADNFEALQQSTLPKREMHAKAKAPKPRSQVRSRADAPDAPAPPERPARKPPRPSRERLDDAEAALARADAEFEAELRKIAEMAKDLEERRRVLKDAHSRHRDKLEAARDRAAIAYRSKIEQWARN